MSILRLLLLTLSLVAFNSLGQNPLQWKSLPSASLIKTTNTTLGSEITKFKIEDTRDKVNFVKHSIPSFSGTIKPKTLSNIEFTKSRLVTVEEVDFEGDFFLKDVSKLNIKYLDGIHGLPAKSIGAVCEDSEGRMLMASDNGLIIYNGVKFTVYQSKTSFALNSIESLDKDSKGRIWISTHGGVLGE